MEEIWRNINGFENYMVSNYGKLKRINKNGEKIIKGHLNKDKIQLELRNNGNVLNISLAKLVAQTFIRDLKENEIPTHIDGNKLNNRHDNLKILTLKEAGKISANKYINLIDRDKLEKDFIDKFNSLHGDKWKYVSGYINNKSNVLIKCKDCGEIRSVYADRSKRKDANILCKKCNENNFKNEFNNKYKINMNI